MKQKLFHILDYHSNIGPSNRIDHKAFGVLSSWISNSPVQATFVLAFGMSDVAKLDITGRRHQQGIIHTSVTRLSDKVGELEMKERLSPVDRLAA